MISKVLDLKDMARCFALVTPVFSIGIENTMTKQVIHCISKYRSLDIVFKVVYNQDGINIKVYTGYTVYILLRTCSTLRGSIVPTIRGMPIADTVLHASWLIWLLSSNKEGLHVWLIQESERFYKKVVDIVLPLKNNGQIAHQRPSWLCDNILTSCIKHSSVMINGCQSTQCC